MNIFVIQNFLFYIGGSIGSIVVIGTSLFAVRGDIKIDKNYYLAIGFGFLEILTMFVGLYIFGN